jgi:hypothetical protein
VKSSATKIAEMARLLEIRQQSGYTTILVLGARTGAFYRRSSTLGELLMPFSERSFEKLSPTAVFGECHRVLSERSFSERDLHFILNVVIQEATVEDADICLAELIKQGYFGEIITTNIDDLLEQAFNEVQMREGQHYDVFIAGRSAPRHLVNSEHKLCRVIKVFGDFIARAYEVKRHRSYLDHQPDLKFYLERALGADILAIGLDPIWDAELINLIPPGEEQSSVWLVDEDQPHPESLIARTFQGRQTVYLTGRDFHYGGFLKGLHWQLTSRLPQSYQITQEILNELRTISNGYRSLRKERQETWNAVQAALREIDYLRREMSQNFQNLQVELSNLKKEIGHLKRQLRQGE